MKAAVACTALSAISCQGQLNNLPLAFQQLSSQHWTSAAAASSLVHHAGYPYAKELLLHYTVRKGLNKGEDQELLFQAHHRRCG